MNKSTKEIIQSIASQIEEIREMQNAVMAAKSYIRNKTNGRNEVNSGDLMELLFKDELDLWRNLFCFALVCDMDTQSRIKAAGYERFLKRKMDVSRWLNEDKIGKWLDVPEKQFREMARELYLKEGGEN
jgi:hypothetical protein